MQGSSRWGRSGATSLERARTGVYGVVPCHSGCKSIKSKVLEAARSPWLSACQRGTFSIGVDHRLVPPNVPGCERYYSR